MAAVGDMEIIGRPDPVLLKKRQALEMNYLESWLGHGRRRIHWENLKEVHIFVGAVLKFIGLMERGRANARDVRLKEVEFSFERLPQAFDGFTMLQLSDLHIDGLAGLSRAIAEVISGVRVDLAVLTGDYRFEVHGPVHGVYAGMAEVLEAVDSRLGVVGILGNHDFLEEAEGLEKLGVKMLINQALRIEEKGQKIIMLGLDDAWYYQASDLKSVTGLADGDEFSIMLCHCPDLAGEAAAAGVDLFLTGHTHAGQIRLPFIGPLILNSSAPRRLTAGAWRVGSMQGYTSFGTGSSCVPVRFNCPPEATLIRLKAAPLKEA